MNSTIVLTVTLFIAGCSTTPVYTHTDRDDSLCDWSNGAFPIHHVESRGCVKPEFFEDQDRENIESNMDTTGEDFINKGEN